jgi:hypothetical protein
MHINANCLIQTSISTFNKENAYLAIVLPSMTQANGRSSLEVNSDILYMKSSIYFIGFFSYVI